MPETAAAQFEHAVTRLDEIHADLRRARRRDRIVGAAAVIVTFLTGWWIVERIHDSSQSGLVRCRDSNVRFDGMMDVLEESLGDDQAALLIIDQLREVSVIDCDRDGTTTDDLAA